MSFKGRMLKLGLKAAEHGPAIALGVGIATGVGAIIFAVRAGRRTDEIVNDTNAAIDAIHEKMAALNEGDENYEEEVVTLTKELSKSKRKCFLKLAALYGPVIACEAISCICLIGGHITMQRRLTGALTAYTGLLATYTELCSKLTDEVGEERARELIEAHESVDVVDAETGEISKVTTFSETSNPYIFDWNQFTCPCACAGGNEDQPMLDMWIHHMEAEANDLVQIHGYLLLNEVLNRIGFPQKTSIGSVSGWVYNPDKPISFGIVYGREFDEDGYPYDTWRLHFNCDDQLIWDKIDDLEENFRPHNIRRLGGNT